MTEFVLKNANIVLPNEVVRGSIHVQNGQISSIDSGDSHLTSALDCDGDCIIPGLIELHTDNIERHLMPRPNAFWPTEAAVLNHDREIASVGITTVFNAICVGDVNARSMRMEVLQDLCSSVLKHINADTLKAEHFIHLRCEISYGGLMDFLDPLVKMDRVALMSVMDHTPGQRQFVDINRYAEYYQGKFGLTDEELQKFMAERRADQEKYSADNRRSVVDRAHTYNIKLASHDDATEDHVAEAIEDKIAIAEFPTTFEAAKASHNAGLAVLMGGPNIVRGKSHSGNISARDLAAQGILDIISSDYVPSSLLYAALILEKHIDQVSLSQAIATVTSTPARSVGLEDRGTIEAGLRADLVRYRPTGGAPIIRDVWKAGEKIA